MSAVSSLQTGVFSGTVGVRVGRHRFSDAAVVREEQPAEWRYTPRYARIEIRCRAIADPDAKVALWMIGIEDFGGASGGRYPKEFVVDRVRGVRR